YEVDGKKYLWIRKFEEHQRPHHTEAESIIPAWNGSLPVISPLKQREDPPVLKEALKEAVVNEALKEKEGIKGLDEFRVFWEAYPKKVGKGEARKAWGKKGTVSLSHILEAIQKQKEHWREPRFIPNPATWLNQERWDDEPPKSAAQEIWDRAQEEKRHDT
ncbi:hypothetical protein LCGC14_2818630, partial [marine sediment metagenome]